MNKNDPKLKPNIQLFADPDGEAQTENEPTAGDNTEPKQADIKDELEMLRSDNKLYENTLRSIFGVADGEELGNINKRIAEFNGNLQAKLSAVNDKMIAAEIKSMQGYDSKLLAKVIDRSNIKVNDDGTITGLQEAVATAAEEFPAVVVKQEKSSAPYAPYHPAGEPAAKRTMNDILRRR